MAIKVNIVKAIRVGKRYILTVFFINFACSIWIFSG